MVVRRKLICTVRRTRTEPILIEVNIFGGGPRTVIFERLGSDYSRVCRRCNLTNCELKFFYSQRVEPHDVPNFDICCVESRSIYTYFLRGYINHILQPSLGAKINHINFMFHFEARCCIIWTIVFVRLYVCIPFHGKVRVSCRVEKEVNRVLYFFEIAIMNYYCHLVEVSRRT